MSRGKAFIVVLGVDRTKGVFDGNIFYEFLWTW